MGAIGTGASISFSSSFLAEILDIRGPSAARESIDTTHMGSTLAKTFTPGDLADWGDLVVELAFNPATKPPISSAASAVVITWRGGSTWSFSGFLTGFEPQAPLEGRMTATATIKISGDVTVA